MNSSPISEDPLANEGTVTGDDGQAVPTDMPSIHAAEESLSAALAEVDRTEKELRSAEEVLERLQGELAGRLGEAERLMTMVAEAYERERERLERELQSIQARAWDLEHVRDVRVEPAEPTEPAKPDAGPEPDAGVLRDVAAAVPDPVAEPVAPAVADLVMEKPVAPAVADLVTEKPVAPAVADRVAEKPAAVETDLPKAAPPSAAAWATTEGAEENESEAYEDHWYHVLRRGELGSEDLGNGSQPSDAPAGR